MVWPKALTIPHSLLDCADEVIEYQKTVAMHGPDWHFLTWSAAGNQPKHQADDTHAQIARDLGVSYRPSNGPSAVLVLRATTEWLRLPLQPITSDSAALLTFAQAARPAGQYCSPSKNSTGRPQANDLTR